MTALSIEVSSEGNQNDVVDEPELVEWEETIAEKWSRHDIKEGVKFEALLYGEDILEWSLHDLRSAEVSIQN